MLSSACDTISVPTLLDFKLVKQCDDNLLSTWLHYMPLE